MAKLTGSDSWTASTAAYDIHQGGLFLRNVNQLEWFLIFRKKLNPPTIATDERNSLEVVSSQRLFVRPLQRHFGYKQSPKYSSVVFNYGDA